MSILNDNHNIIGVSKLINDRNFDIDKNLEELEREIVEGANLLDYKSEIDPTEEYKRELDKIIKKSNDMMNDEKVTPISPTMKIMPIYDKYNEMNKMRKGGYNINEEEREEDNESYENRDNYNREDHNRYDYEDKTKKYMGNVRYNYHSKDKDMQRLTNEEKRQDHISNVINNMGGVEYNAFNIEKEQEEDDKIILLEQIDMLRQILEDDGIDVSRVPEVTTESGLKEIKNVSRILKLKNDRNRLSSLAEEGILLFAAGLEFLFDGKKEYFGFQPDLLGWSETVKVKLRRLKFETSEIVSNTIRKRNISSGTRLAMELLPSMFLYSRSKKQMAMRNNKDRIISDDKYKKAISELNSMN